MNKKTMETLKIVDALIKKPDKHFSAQQANECYNKASAIALMEILRILGDTEA